MAKRKSTKKAVKKSSGLQTGSFSELFANHPNLKWLLVVLVIAFGFFLIVHHMAEESIGNYQMMHSSTY